VNETAVTVMYHFAAKERAAAIAAHGLAPKPTGFADNPDGVYLWEFDPRSDELLREMGADFNPAQGDLYAVDVAGLRLQPDRWLPYAHYASEPIGPDRVRRIGAAGPIYYHVAPPSMRDAIRVDEMLWAGQDEECDLDEQGVYLFDNLANCHRFGRTVSNVPWFPDGSDIWQVELDPEDAAGLVPDPRELGGLFYETEHALTPLAMTLLASEGSDG